MKSFIAAACLAAMLSSSPVIAGDVAVGASFGAACPVFDDLLTFYNLGFDLEADEYFTFIRKHDCEMLAAGAEYHLVERDAHVTRILVHGTAMYARTVDFLP